MEIMNKKVLIVRILMAILDTALVSRSDSKPLDNGGLLKKSSIAIKIRMTIAFFFIISGVAMT